MISLICGTPHMALLKSEPNLAVGYKPYQLISGTADKKVLHSPQKTGQTHDKEARPYLEDLYTIKL